MLRSAAAILVVCTTHLLNPPFDCVVHGFASSNKKNRRQRRDAGGASSRSSDKGFGTAPPSFDDVVNQFRNRLPSDSDAVQCPCGSGVSYASCCEPFHVGTTNKGCLTPEDVLRTRYSAFSYRLIKYIIETTHPTCRDYQQDKVAWAKQLNKDGMFDSYSFVELKIVGRQDETMIETNNSEDEEVNTNDEAFVDFTVRLRAKENQGSALAGKETIISERSRFLRNVDDGTWSYAGGEVRSEEAGLEGTILN